MSDEVFSIFILKSNPNSMAQAETYLRNRNWTVGSSSNLKDALAYIVQKQPQYVLITVDHPNKKVKSLPKMLVQAFPVRVIAFAEKGGPASMQIMNEMNLQYNLYPPVSGPGIQRLILKIRKDEHLSDQLYLDETTTPRSTSYGVPKMTFRGQTPSSAEAEESFEQARAALMQMAATEPGIESTGSGLIVQKGQAFKRGAAYVPKQEERKKDGSYWPDHEAKSNQNSLRQEGDNSTSRKINSKDNSPQRLDESDSSGTSNVDTHQVTTEYIQQSDGKSYRITSTPKEDLSKQSIIVRGAQQALDETVVVSSNSKVQALEKASHVACITVEGPRFSGYLVCALGKNKKIDKSFITTVQKRLFAYLRSNGETVKDKDLLDLKIQEVDFQDWALEQAEFLRKSIHDGDEVAMAFFPTKDLEVQLEDSASEKMVKMDISELKDDTPLEFDLYIYMPENNKYLLYTPQGMPLYGRQKDRLLEKGITHMHLRRESTASVKKYRAQNFLNERIAQYRAASQNKKKSE